MVDEPTDTHPSGPRAGSRFGPYLLRRLLGRGGFGEVYEAEDTAMHRVVALKLLSSSYSHNPAFRERLFREARTAGRLHDPHVVPVHSCGEIDGQLYIDMRLIDGTDLQGVLDREGALDPGRAVAITRQIASALDAAHAERVIHRDVKPANILLGRNDFASLVDFGLANAATDTKLTSEGTTIGSFAYLAPERLTNGQVTPAADIYALACVLYECLTGSHPFPGRDEIPSLVAAHLTAPIPLPSRQRPGLPVGFDEVIARGMAKNPGERYRSAGELAAAAQRALHTGAPEQGWASAPTTQPWQQDRDRTVPRAAPPAFHPPAKPRKARRRIVIAVVIAAVIAASIAAVALVRVGNRSTSPGGAPGATTTSRSAAATSTAPPLNATPLPVVGTGDLLGVAVDDRGDIYVVDEIAKRVLELPVGATAARELPFPPLEDPKRVAADGAGNVYVVDWTKSNGAGRVWKLPPGATGATELPFGRIRPEDVATDAAGNVYTASVDRVLELPVGATNPTVLPLGSGYFTSVAVDKTGNVYAADRGRVFRLRPGAPTADQLPFAALGSAHGLAVDARGDVYVLDNANLMGRVIRLPAGANTSIQLFATESQEFGGIALDEAGNLYLTENKRLLKLAVA
ncbi:serine/threonine-protein kinase [Mycobacterium sp. Marseille-P9652]|uniref:serine/threonine-protein kinase n=1 Tax=Mycobacterium sp. Marseille-P9652 TaxID=2654950 RepID=UPI0012E6F812|nr:serine/threonine-protein kinase [Mycobacterium sp. Marseille-P9652]